MSSPRLALVALALTSLAIPAHAPRARDPRAELTVTPAWLAQHLKDPDLVLLHVGDKGEYDKGHIAGARYVTQRDISVSNHDRAKDTGLMLELPTDDSLRTQLAALGISDGSRIVVYYGNDWVSPSTRIMFTLDHAGFGGRSALLDGGMNAWKEAGFPLTTEIPTYKTGQLSPLKTRPLVVSIDYVKSRLGSPNLHLIDGRAAVFYDGVEEGSSRKGHIPGAKSIPFTEVTDDKLHLKSAAELTKLFTDAGVGPKDTVVAYCHIGQQATAVLFAARTLGHPVLLFDGSFQEWGRRTDLPVENPAEGKKQ
ncbi:MAG TPA: rhodanese-like domain-containing protein [Gemmatimonadaceae bacterium]|nr:rhodanese-like domain-containing protein [Gemmatimonadaceae bacterium]